MNTATENMTAHERVYTVQCFTFSMCLKLLSLPESDTGLATPINSPVMYFRLKPAYRCAFSLALRKQVADMVRNFRKNKVKP